MKKIRFVMIGGFLGAGKTTAIARLAKHYVGAGLQVGLVTNDQAYDLVDTHSLRAQGFQVGEVPGACFCCKFDDLVATAAELSADALPDVIITEPVGSCTDLVATVIEPLRALHGDQYELAPLVVLLKPEHGRKILGQTGGVGFSPKAEYIFLKQLEEAGVVAINKIDKLSPAEQEELAELVRDRFPNKQVLLLSAKTGLGFDELRAALEQENSPPARMMDVDYQIYAEGEAELGWLNCTARVTSLAGQGAFALDPLLVRLVAALRAALLAHDAEPAHLKILGLAEGETGIANLVGSGVDVELSLASEQTVTAAELVINARVGIDPEQLAELVEQELLALATSEGLQIAISAIQRFRPSPPVPTHRVRV